MHSYDVLVNREHVLTKDDVPRDLRMCAIPFAPGTANDKQQMREEASKWAARLFQRAEMEAIDLAGVSAYRSYERQKHIYDESIRRKGAEHTRKYIAKPGTSEHQTGLALDVSSRNMDYELETEFANTDEGKWLHHHAPLYGFVLRYPYNKEEITGYAFEPWHIRYVTRPLALYLAKTDKTLEEFHELNHRVS